MSAGCEIGPAFYGMQISSGSSLFSKHTFFFFSERGGKCIKERGKNNMTDHGLLSVESTFPITRTQKIDIDVIQYTDVIIRILRNSTHIH